MTIFNQLDRDLKRAYDGDEAAALRTVDGFRALNEGLADIVDRCLADYLSGDPSTLADRLRAGGLVRAADAVENGGHS